MSGTKRAAGAAAANALLSIASLGIGIALMSMLGGSGGTDLGGQATAADFAAATPLIVVAELVKFAIAGTQALVVVHLARRAGTGRALLLAAGLAGSAGVAASGVAGLWALVTLTPMMPLIASFGLAGLAATGLWALLLLRHAPLETPTWHKALTVPFALLSIAAPFFPPAAFPGALLGWAWWFGLAAFLGRESGGGDARSAGAERQAFRSSPQG